MTKTKQTQEKVVDWVLPAKKVIKFQDSEDTYTLANQVAKLDFDKYPINEGDVVDVGIDDDTVNFMRKKKGAKRTPKPATTTSNSNLESRVMTIAGIPSNKEVIKFKEDEKTWFPVDDKVKDLDFKALGIVAKAKVNVTFGKTKKVKGKEVGVITYIEVVKEEKTDNPQTTSNVETTTVTYNGRNSSIEKQCAVKSACEVVKSLVEKGVIEELKDVKNAVTEVATECLKFIEGR